MTDNSGPLTEDEIADLHHLYGDCNEGTAQIVNRLIATIERRDEQIEKLRTALIESRDALNRQIDEAITTAESGK